MVEWYVIKRKRKRKPKRRRYRKPDHTIEQILAWADRHRALTGNWPRHLSGRVIGARDESWAAIDMALRNGSRGLPGGSSLIQVLARHRGVRDKYRLPRYTAGQILDWADAFHGRTGDWPHRDSGPIAGAPGETWMAVHIALSKGRRGLPGGTSLPRFLAEHRGVRNHLALPPLTEEQILAWADAHHQRTGRWPGLHDGPVAGAPAESWYNVDAALRAGARGLPGGSSLARLLAEHHRVRNRKGLPPLTEAQILAWADAHHQRTGRWPIRESGPIVDAPGETWAGVDSALRAGVRGQPGGSSLAQLLARCRGVRNKKRLPKFTVRQIGKWMKAHFRRTGRWPNEDSGPILEAPGETWQNVDMALRAGCRGLPGGSSLYRLRRKREKKRGSGA